MQRSGLKIRAVATLETKFSSIQRTDGKNNYLNSQLGGDLQTLSHQSECGEEAEVGEREMLRRKRISRANKGNTPWNKGKKHSPETLRRIKERTRIAMQNPKVKMKLANLGHAQSEETRIKIGAGVRIGWERRRKKRKLQETCHYEWQNLIAEASRRGYEDQLELQWNSYKMIDEQLTCEWLEALEQKKKSFTPKGSKRAPKSLEQRRKISAAISAKWSDPAYRERVYSGLSKYHCSTDGVPKPIRKISDADKENRKRSAAKKKSVASSVVETDLNIAQRPKLKKSKMPLYKDPLASSKLEMIKNIRASRTAAENEKSEAVHRARLLIAEAERAADALEIAAKTSLLARESLIETRKLIAEAIQSLESTHIEQDEQVHDSPLVENLENQSQESEEKQVNGSRSDHLGMVDLGFGKFTLQELLNSEQDETDDDEFDDDGLIMNGIYDDDDDENDDDDDDVDNVTELVNGCINGIKKAKTKKWVCGKLVEVEAD
jgi:hypothetical protein